MFLGAVRSVGFFAPHHGRVWGLEALGLWQWPVEFCLLLVFSVVLVPMFHDPEHILREVGGSVKDEKAFDRLLPAAILPAAAYLFFFYAPLPKAVPVWFGFFKDVWFISLAAVAMDVASEVRFRRRYGALASVREFHSVPSAGLAESLFKDKGIPCFVRGYYYRALRYLFGPFVEMSLWVPEASLAEARTLLNELAPEKREVLP